MTSFDRIIIFTDGACSGNPGKGGWGAIVVRPNGLVKELGDYAEGTTNNRMELAATIFSLKSVADDEAGVDLYTDSVYVIRGITQWIWGWRKRQWKTAEGEDVANKDSWEALAEIVSQRTGKRAIKWHWVRGHTGVPGNVRVDEIGVMFSKGKKPILYDGPLLTYDVAVHDIPENTDLPEQKDPTEKKPKAFSYVSLVNGVAKRHATWAECERDVKGRSGAKFKKTLSQSHESEILTAWGVDPSDVKG